MSLEEFRREQWGVERILFSVSTPERRYLDKVFTGRADELEYTRISLYEAPRRVLVNGLFGIGKTIFIRELLAEFERRYQSEVLTVYESVSVGSTDLPATILRGLARILRDEDEDARQLDATLADIEITTEKEREVSGGAEVAGIGGKAAVTDTTTRAIKTVTNAAYHIQRLIERAVKRKPERRLVVAVDDLDKRDPETIRRSLHDTRNILHLECSYVLTGHPLGVLRDAYSTAGGIFDKQVDLRLFTPDESLEMMKNYLAAGRIKSSRTQGLAPFTEAAAYIIAESSFGIPRILNSICFHILEEAADKRLPFIDVLELRQCWEAAQGHLRRGITADLRNLLETLQEYEQGFTPTDVPDEIFARLNVDSYSELITKLDQTVRSDWVVNVQEHYVPNPLLRPLNVQLPKL
jgi:hypothetical protein